MENNTYVWYGKASEESGKLLAQLLGVENHGTLPPKDFAGVLICYGATPADKFKYEERKTRAIFNDPRRIRKYLDRRAMFDALAVAGFSVPKIVPINQYESYNSTCEKLGVDSAGGLCLFKANGADAKPAFSELGFGELAKGMVYAAGPDFMSINRTRAFIVDGVFVGALIQSNDNSPNFAKQAALEQAVVEDKSKAEQLLSYLLERGFIKANNAYWQVQNAVHPKLIEAAIGASKALKYDFCAVDMCEKDGKVVIMNVVTTPSIVGHEVIHGVLASQIKLWMKRADRSYKEILAEISEKADEKEAEEIVAELLKARAEG